MERLAIEGDDPQNRFGHTITQVSPTKAVLFGGAISSNNNYIITNHTFVYDCVNQYWRQIHPKNESQNGPSQRAAHASACVEEMQMVVFGGAIGHGSNADDDLYLLKNLETGDGNWVKVPVEGMLVN